MKLITKTISNDRASDIMHNSKNIFSLPIYHSELINPYRPLSRKLQRRYNDTYVIIRSILNKYNFIRNKVVYDITCNIGTMSFLFNEYNPKMIIGLDTDEEVLLLAQYIKNMKFQKANIFFICSDITTESVITREDNIGFLLNLPFHSINTMQKDIDSFLERNTPGMLFIDNTYDKYIYDIIIKRYKIEKKFAYYNLFKVSDDETLSQDNQDNDNNDDKKSDEDNSATNSEEDNTSDKDDQLSSSPEEQDDDIDSLLNTIG